MLLYGQGYKTAEELSSKIVLLFQLCKDQLSNQSHYDFGLRAIKSVLSTAGSLRRGVGSSSDAKDAELEPEVFLYF